MKKCSLKTRLKQKIGYTVLIKKLSLTKRHRYGWLKLTKMNKVECIFLNFVFFFLKGKYKCQAKIKFEKRPMHFNAQTVSL